MKATSFIFDAARELEDMRALSRKSQTRRNPDGNARSQAKFAELDVSDEESCENSNPQCYCSVEFPALSQMSLLSQACFSSANFSALQLEQIEERAAIKEYSAGIPRFAAEWQALAERLASEGRGHTASIASRSFWRELTAPITEKHKPLGPSYGHATCG